MFRTPVVQAALRDCGVAMQGSQTEILMTKRYSAPCSITKQSSSLLRQKTS